MSRTISDEQIIRALLENDTQAKAAESLGITPQTIVNRQKKADFVAKYNSCQSEILRSTTRKLSNAGGKCVDLLIDTMNDSEVALPLRVSIAKDILRFQRDFVNIDELQRRIAQIEYIQALKDQEKQTPKVDELPPYRTFSKE